MPEAGFDVALRAQQKVIPLYSGAAPGSEGWTWSEQESDKNMYHSNADDQVDQQKCYRNTNKLLIFVLDVLSRFHKPTPCGGCQYWHGTLKKRYFFAPTTKGEAFSNSN